MSGGDVSESEEYLCGHYLISTTLTFVHGVDWRGKCVLFFDETEEVFLVQIDTDLKRRNYYQNGDYDFLLCVCQCNDGDAKNSSTYLKLAAM